MPYELAVTVCQVATPEGMKHYVTMLSHEDAFSRGLAPEAIVGVLSAEWKAPDPITPMVFTRNKTFVDFLHEVISQHAPKQPAFQAEAQRIGDGWVWIIDQRTPTPDGPVPPEDIFGGFEVKSGGVVQGSYQQCPKHRILSELGFMRLDEALHRCLLEDLANRTATSSNELKG